MSLCRHLNSSSRLPPKDNSRHTQPRQMPFQTNDQNSMTRTLNLTLYRGTYLFCQNFYKIIQKKDCVIICHDIPSNPFLFLSKCFQNYACHSNCLWVWVFIVFFVSGGIFWDPKRTKKMKAIAVTLWELYLKRYIRGLC